MSQLKFTKTHEWVSTHNETLAVGITEHAQELLGDLVYVELPETGKQVQAGDELGVVESVKAASDFYAPISGTVIAVNEEVSANPELVNTDPLGTGWLVKIKPSNPEELSQLLNADEYQHHISEEH